MKKIRDITERKVTYQYENENMKDIHMNQMFNDGWRLSYGGTLESFLGDDKLKVTYVISTDNTYSVARL